jgi:hypothetical protein
LVGLRHVRLAGNLRNAGSPVLLKPSAWTGTLITIMRSPAGADRCRM